MELLSIRYKGVAHSDPEPIEDLPFTLMLRQAIELNDKDKSTSENLRFLHERTVEAYQDIQNHNPIARDYLRLQSQIMRLERMHEFEELMHYASFNLFCNVAKLRWLAV